MSVDRHRSGLDSEPKPKGVKISIPSPQSLHKWVKKEALLCGEKPLKVIEEEMRRWSNNKSLPEPHAITVESEMDGDLFTKFSIKIRAGYSIKTGEWGELTSYLWTANSQKRFEISGRSEEICDELKRMSRVYLDKDYYEGNTIHMLGSNSISMLAFRLGHKSYENVVDAFGQEFANEESNYPIIIEPQDNGNLSLIYDEFEKQLRKFQVNAPLGIAGIYNVFGIRPPNVTLQISVW